MKTFNFRKLGILLVMMLVGGMVLVGSASAVTSSTSTNNYRVTAVNNWISSPNELEYIGTVVEKNDNYGAMSLTVQLTGVDVYQSPKSYSTSNAFELSSGYHFYSDSNPTTTPYRPTLTARFSARGESGTAIAILS
ncbi:hypothetical protein [Methanolacinia paynteri]|uniref:hypothetical protein n=1 Tax=Methanolacinia paynteri TaxID=230356 RepID=UPI0012F62EE5|nr:hypothetical protein [Methanolacinia paynteri]